MPYCEATVYLHNRSTNSEFVEKYGKYNNDDVVSVRKSRESRQAAKYSRKREREQKNS